MEALLVRESPLATSTVLALAGLLVLAVVMRLRQDVSREGDPGTMAVLEWLSRRIRSRVQSFGLVEGVTFGVLDSRLTVSTTQVQAPNGMGTVWVRLGRRQSDMQTLLDVFGGG